MVSLRSRSLDDSTSYQALPDDSKVKGPGRKPKIIVLSAIVISLGVVVLERVSSSFLNSANSSSLRSYSFEPINHKLNFAAELLDLTSPVDCLMFPEEPDKHLWFFNFTSFTTIVDQASWFGKAAEIHDSSFQASPKISSSPVAYR